MGKNCLVTKLKESVSDSNLSKLGALTIKINATTSGNPSDHIYISRAVDKPLKAKASGNYIAANASDLSANPTSEISTVEGYLYYKSIGIDYAVELSPKYNISQIASQDGFNSFEFDLSELNYCTELTKLQFNDCNIYGKLDCTLLTKLTTLSFHTNINKVSLNINSLKNCSVLTSVNLPNKAYGDLLSLGKDMANSGHVSRAISVSNSNNGDVYFGAYKMVSYLQLNWDSTTKIYVQAPYVNKVFCSGYSDTDIISNRASGKKWNGLEVTDVDTGNVYTNPL